MKRIRGWSAVAAVVVFTLCLATPASSQAARGPATRFTPAHPIDYPDVPPPVDYTGDPDYGQGYTSLIELMWQSMRVRYQLPYRAARPARGARAVRTSLRWTRRIQLP